MIVKATTAAFLKWVKGPISIVGGLVGTWLYTNIPGLHVFGGSAASTGKWLSGALVFGITSGVTYLSHDQAVTHLVGTIVKDVTSASAIPASDGVKTSS